MAALKDYSGHIVAGGAAQDALPANDAREYVLFQNTSDTDMYLDFDADAAAATGIRIVPNGSYEQYFKERKFIRGRLSVFCATTGKAFCCKEA